MDWITLASVLLEIFESQHASVGDVAAQQRPDSRINSTSRSVIICSTSFEKIITY